MFLTHILKGVDNEESARKISFVYYVSLLNCLLFVAIIPIAFITNADLDTFLIIILAIALSLVPLFTLYYKVSLKFTYLFFILLVFLELVMLQFYYGGFTPNITIFYPCIVPLGFILFGKREGIIVSLFIGLIISAFFLLDRFGFDFPPVPEDYTKDPVLSKYVTLLMSIVLVSFFSYQFISTYLKKADKEKKLIKSLHSAEIENLESKAKELEMKKVAEYRKRFLAHMSHEIRTPLNGIIGVLEMLELSTLNDNQKELVSIIKNSSGSLQGILNKVLDLSKIEAGQINVSEESISVDQIVVNTVNLFKASAKKKGLSISHLSGDNFPEKIVGDKNLITQILSNLIGNAVKFTNQGEIAVSYSINNGYYRIEVHDTGKGISETQLKELFTEYHQLDNQHGDIKGTGLGLMISKQLVELQKGNIGVYKNENSGSTFWFELPLKQVTNSDTEIDTETDTDTKQVSGLKILVVDDKKVNLTVAKLMLEKLGNAVSVLDSGIDIEKHINKSSFDLILLDINMPDITGVEVLQNIKSNFPELNSKIFALTANAMEGDKEMYLEIGFDGYISKPLTLNKINKELSSLM